MSADFYLCPGCGGEVRVGSPGCSRCHPPKKSPAQAARKSWESDEYLDGLDLPDEEPFDYDRFLAEELGEKPQIKPSGISWLWWATGLVLFLILVFLWSGLF